MPKLPEKDASKITAVHIKGAQKITGSELEKELGKLDGSTLTARTIPDLITGFANHPTDGLVGISVEAVRDDDLTGVEISIELVAGDYPISDGWRHHHDVLLGTAVLTNSTGSCVPSFAGEDECWKDLTSGTANALKASATTEFVIRAGIEAEK